MDLTYELHYLKHSDPAYRLALINMIEWDMVHYKVVVNEGFIPSEAGENPLEWLFEEYNIGEGMKLAAHFPEGYRRSMSPGDRVVLKFGGVERWERCDPVGWTTEQIVTRIGGN
jgi:hypothetical protein